ncbi:unnamed protein product, partial [marine sediment metagenome]
LSDNDRAGIYLEDKLTELIYPCIKEINLEDFKIDIFNSIDLKTMIDGHESDINEKEYDENLETENECPKCGYKW